MEIHPVCNLSVARHAVQAAGGAVTMEGWMRRFIGPGLQAFEAMLEDGRFCLGETVSLPDLCLVPQVYNANRWGVDLSEMPKIRRIAAALEEIPAFAAAHPDVVRPR
jgi:maleylacetoacetate isomerase